MSYRCDGAMLKLRSRVVERAFIHNGSLSTTPRFFNIAETNESTDILPLIVPYSLDIIGLSFINTVDNVNADITFYINSLPVFTWGLINVRWKMQIFVLPPFLIVPGDKLSITGVDSSPPPVDSLLRIFFNISTSTLLPEIISSPTL